MVTLRAPLSAPAVFLVHLKGLRIPCPVGEFHFSDERLWRFDFAWPEEKLAVEIEGGVSDRRRGRHIRAGGYQDDLDKYNTAVLMGWRLLRFSTRDVMQGVAATFVRDAFKKEPAP